MRWLLGSSIYALTLGRRAPRSFFAVAPDQWPGDPAAGQRLLNGAFAAHGTVDAAIPDDDDPPWQREGADPLWLADLNSFEWLRDLRDCGDPNGAAVAVQLVDDWMAREWCWSPLTWRRDVLAARLVVWIRHYDWLSEAADPGFGARFVQSLARQRTHLRRAARTNMVGHEAVAALKALIFADLAFLRDGKKFEKSLDHTLNRLARFVKRYVLHDGVVAERAPQVHVAVLRHLEDVRAALMSADRRPPAELLAAIDRMAPMLRFFRHGDGALTLFNDSHESEAWLIDVVLTQSEARGKPLVSAPHTGFERMQAGRALLIFDSGVPEPKAADSAFAGTLAFELGLGKERMIVNCGGGPADEPGWGAALRATAAHSTLTLAEANSTEIVFSPRGTRYKAAVRMVTGSRDEAEGAIWIERSHDGYSGRFGFLHQRKLYLAAGGDDLRGEDALLPAPKSSARKRRKPQIFAVRFHLHPGVQATQLQDGGILLRLPSGIGWRFAARGGEIRIEESIYFGGPTPRRTRQLVVEGQTVAEGINIKWAFRRVPERGAEA